MMEEDLVLTRRLLVFEQQVWLDTQVQASRNVEERNSAQQLDLTIRYPGLDVPTPSATCAWWRSRTCAGTPPTAASSHTLRAHQRTDHATFPTRACSPGTMVAQLRREGPALPAPAGGQHRERPASRTCSWCRTPSATSGLLRAARHQRTLPGAARGVRRPDRNADYVNVHFTLKLDAPLPRGGVYVYGALSDFQCRKEFRMTWDREAGPLPP